MLPLRLLSLADSHRRVAPKSMLWVGLLVGCALGCGSHDKVSSGSSSSTVDDVKADRDAGSGRDAPTKRDAQAGRTDAGRTTTSNPTSSVVPNSDLELMKIDDCGDDNPAGLEQDDVDKLKAGGSPATLKLLYPYDGTIFPRGLAAPLWMWDGSGARAVYLSIRSQFFEYDGCLKPTAAGQIQLGQEVWDAAGRQTLGPKTPFTITLTTLDGTKVRGPIEHKVVIARATLNGSVFYNSYNSKLAGGALGGLGGFGGLGGLGGLGGGTGALLRLKPGKTAEYFARQGSCTGCHAVSANGERMIAKEISGLADGQLYSLEPDTALNPAPARVVNNSAFVGLSPDGKVYLTTATGNGVGPEVNGGIGTPFGGVASGLFDTDTGDAITNTGIPTSAMMPTFSADGTLLVFNDFSQGNGRTISVMDYDSQGRTASNQRELYKGKGNDYLGWPFMLPDNGASIFTVGESSNFSGNGVGINGFAARGPKSDLMIADAETGNGSLLARAMGFDDVDAASHEDTYLPFGTEELHQNYYPTVSPVASGGYFWLFFDSVRHYGNLGVQRALWGAAIAIQGQGGEFQDPNGRYASDPSFPAFYLPGQELGTANHRAFTALDPCHSDGQSCETGVDCCSGFCTDGVCGKKMGCADTSEACTTDGDCCQGAGSCIGGYCSVILL